ncbi:toll/interleukin-1 receptor domain-containing protein [Nocardia canadensis]|uniref:toll/interleukin-1 receptor domain-containing protein n=1 Tax=Nocardia canadensis TaxID=3065238 RepID=UPI00292EEA53|nr:TIR domain-containing protein [Nocardia canadensis]
MAEQTMIAADPPPSPAPPPAYDAFLSYSHADRAIAAGIQRGLHRIGRRVGRLHALRVFRDATDLTASPDLWGKVAEAMDQARYCIVVLSPHSAASEWVDREIGYWLRTRGPDQLLFVVAGGQVKWDRDTHRFDPARSTVALPVLTQPGSLPTEPLYVDVTEDAPWDPRAALFREKLTDLAAPIHGKPKYELAGEDLREQRRFRRLRRAAVAGLVLLTVLALVAAFIAIDRQQEAVRQRNQAIGLRLISDTESMLGGARPRDDVRAIQQTLAARQITPDFDEGALLRTLNAEVAVDKIVQTGKPYDPLYLPEDLGVLGDYIRTVKPDMGIAFSPVGDRILTIGIEMRLWDAATGSRIDRDFEAPSPGSRALFAAAFSPDGRRIAAATGDGPIRIWDVETGRLVGTPLAGYDTAPNSVAFSPDGGSIAASGKDGTIRWWDIADGRTAVFTGHDGPVHAVAFSPDGRDLVSGGEDTTVRIWKVGSPGDGPETLRRHTYPVKSVAWSPDGRRIASGSVGLAKAAEVAPEFGTALLLWDARTRQPVGTPLVGNEVLVNAVQSVAFSPDSSTLASGSSDNTVRLWDVGSGRAEGQPLTGHAGMVMGVAFSPDGRRLASTAGDGTMRVWNVGTPGSGSLGAPWQQAAGSPKPGFGPVLAFERDGRRFVKMEEGTATVWLTDTQTGDSLALVDFPDGSGARAALSGDGRLVAVAGPDKTVTFYDTATGARIGRPLTGFAEPVSALEFDAGGARLATVTLANVLQLWDTETAAAVGGPFEGLPDADGVVLSSDGRLLAGTDGRTVRLWNTETGATIGEPMTGHTSDLSSLEFDATGTRLLTHSPDSVRLWDLRTGALVKEIQATSIWSVAMAPDGSRFVTGEETTLRRWDLRTGEQLGPAMEGHTAMVRSVAISADSRYIVSGSSDQTLRFWDLGDGHPLGEPLHGSPGWIESVWLYADGSGVLTRSQDFGNNSALWTWPGPTTWADLLCDKLTFEMSRQQWADWVSPDLEYRSGCPGLAPRPDEG